MTTLADDWRNEPTESLFAAILTLRTRDEAAAFFRDLCTLGEIEALSSRWGVVRLLDQGIPYRQIAQETGVSTATITRINQWLQHGAGGYRLALARTKGKR
jgi:TrpR-related protein YerC/YecD